MRKRKNTLEVIDGSHFRVGDATLAIRQDLFGMMLPEPPSTVLAGMHVATAIVRKVVMRSAFIATIYVTTFLVFQQHKDSIRALWMSIL